MRGDFELSDLEAGLVRAEKFQSEQERRNASAHALAVAHGGSGQTGTGDGARGRGRQGRRSGKRHDSGRNQQHQQQGHPQNAPPAPPAQHQHQPPPRQQQQPLQSPAWRRQQQQQRHPQPHQRGPRYQETPHGPWGNWERPPPRQQLNLWTGWERTPPQQQYRSGEPHPRRRHHRGGDQPHWQQALCQWCGEAGHFPQTAGQLGPHPCHSIVRTRHHRFHELTPRSTTPAPLPPGHRTTTMDIRPLQATGLHRYTPATHLPRRCHRRLDLSDRLHELHLHRRLSRKLTGNSPPGAIPGATSTIRASRRVCEFGFQ